MQIFYTVLLLLASSLEGSGTEGSSEYALTGEAGCLSVVTTVVTNAYEYGLEDTLQILIRVQNKADHTDASPTGWRILGWRLSAEDGTTYCSPGKQQEREYVVGLPGWELGPGESLDWQVVVPLAELTPCYMLAHRGVQARGLREETRSPMVLLAGRYQITAGVDSGEILPHACVMIQVK